MGFPGGSEVKESASNAGDLGSIPWRRKWQLIQVFLLGESHGWRSLASYNPWGCKELDMTERLHFTGSPPPIPLFPIPVESLLIGLWGWWLKYEQGEDRKSASEVQG